MPNFLYFKLNKELIVQEKCDMSVIIKSIFKPVQLENYGSVKKLRFYK